MKKSFNYRKSVVLLFLMFFMLGFSKSKVTIDGNINVRISNSSNNRNSNNKKTSSVGNIDDSGYLYKPFIINNKLYMIVIDNFKNKYIVKTDFLNNNPSNAIYSEYAYLLNKHSNNCLSIEGDDNYCFTITYNGKPALYNRVESRYVFEGYFTNSYHNKYDKTPNDFY